MLKMVKNCDFGHILYTLKVLKTSMHATLFSGLVCMACAHYSMHISQGGGVSLESSDQDLIENGKFGALLCIDKLARESVHSTYF